MVETDKKYVILGGGPAGMSCAMELHNAGKKSLVIEKNDKIGGLAKTLEFKEGDLLFRTDIGPHRFFSKNQYLYDFIEKLLGKDWIVVNRLTRQHIEGKFYDYPINAGQAFKNIGLIRSFFMGLSYLYATLRYKIFGKKIENFEDFIVANFGRKLGEFSMLNYTEKIWGLDCKKIHPDWAKQRIKGLDLISVLKDALFKKKGKDGPKSLVDQFYYPRFGTGTIYETIGKRITEGGSEIKTNSYPTKIKHNGKRVEEIEVIINGEKSVLSPEKVVSSIPITEMLQILDPAPPSEVLKAASGLKWRAQVYLFLTLDKELITKDNWIYFPNIEVPFGRISEMKNFSDEMNPKGKTSIFVEFFVTEGDDIWNMEDKDLYELSMKYFEKFGFLKKEDVRKYYVFKKRHVYPVYDLDYVDNLKVIKDYLNEIENFYYIGRPGRFHYTNQDHSLEMGIVTAKSIIDNKKCDLDKIGSENEYFEKGFIKNEGNA